MICFRLSLKSLNITFVKRLVLSIVLVNSPLALSYGFIDQNIELEVLMRPKSLKAASLKDCSAMKVHQIKKIVVSPSQSSLQDYKSIQITHLKKNHFCDIAYHYGITKWNDKYKTHQLRSLKFQGSFLKSQNNNIGIVLQGYYNNQNHVEVEAQQQIKKLALLLKKMIPTINNIEASAFAPNQFKEEINRLNTELFKTKSVADL